MKKIIPYILLIALAMAAPSFSAVHWRCYFNSDQAVAAMRSMHLIENGRFMASICQYEQYGSLPQVLAASLLYLVGLNIKTLTIVVLFYLLLFFIAYSMLIKNLFGDRIALIALGFLALPNMDILVTTVSHQFYLWPALGTTALILTCTWFPGKLWLNQIRLFLIGLLLGFGLWTIGQVFLYCLVILYIIVFKSQEWSFLYKKIDDYVKKVFCISLNIFMPIMFFCLVFTFLWVLSMDTSCKVREVCRAVLFLISAIIGRSLFAVSKRKIKLISNGIVITCGFLIGFAPRIYDWLSFGKTPNDMMLFMFPTLKNVKEFIIEIGPKLIGMQQEWFDQKLPVKSLWILFMVVMCACFAVFIWHNRRSLSLILTLSPIRQKDVPSILFTLLFGIVSFACICHISRNFPVQPVRYAIIAWAATPVIIAYSLSLLLNRHKVAGVLIIIFLVSMLVYARIGDLKLVKAQHEDKNYIWSAENMQKLEKYLREFNIKGGYTDFWQAYVIDFLTEEEFVFASWAHDSNRFPEFLDHIRAFPVITYILRAMPGEYDSIPSETSIDDLIRYIKSVDDHGPGYIMPEVIEHLKKQKILKREKAGVFDVWIVTNDN